MKKIIVDILLLILMLAEYSRQYLPAEIHEIMGIFLIVLVIIHLILNRNYLKAIGKGKYSTKRILELIVNAGFFIAFFLTCIFGILSSQEILAFLNAKSMTIVYLHKILAYLCIILLGIHLGTNLKRMFKKLEKRLGEKVCYIIYLIIIICGAYSFINVDFISHLTGNYGFSAVTGNILVSSLEYLSIILMITIIVYPIEKVSTKQPIKHQ